MIKKILRPILITLIQIIVLVVIHNAFYREYPMKHASVAFGITIKASVLLLSVSLLVFNLYLEFVRRYKYLIGTLLLIVSCVFPMEAIDVRPNQALFLIIMAACGFVSSVLISKLRIKSLHQTPRQ